MKKILMGSFALLLFSAAILLFQVSCKKSADAEPAPGTGNGGTTQLNKVVFTKLNVGAGDEIWIMNYDGSGQTKVNVALKPEQQVAGDVRMSPDGKKLFFVVSTTGVSGNKDDIYSCDIDGKNLVKLYDMPVGGGHTHVGGAY